MENINEIVFESQVAILTGGVDLDGIPLITFPTDAGDLVDIYGSGNILRLLQFYVRLAGGKVAVVADLQHGWAEDCITKLTDLLDKLQMSMRQCLTTVYLVKPRLRKKKKFLFRELSRKYGPGRMVPFYNASPEKTNIKVSACYIYMSMLCRLIPTVKIHFSDIKVRRFESHEELYDYVDKEQLTPDYGGPLHHNHIAWMDFQKTYWPVIKDADNLLPSLPLLKDELRTLLKSGNITQEGSDCRKEMVANYDRLLSKRNVRKILEKCRQSLVDLETPSHDEDESKIHASILVNTTAKLRQLTEKIKTSVEDMDACLSATKPTKETRILERLKQCEENANEVIDTIALLNERVKELPKFGNNITEAINYRQLFVAEILKSSKEIVDCSTVILKRLDTGKETTPKSYAAAFEIAKQLTEALQPFTQEINKLNDTFTRVHLFYMLLEKVERWKNKASEFVIKQLAKQRTESYHQNKDKRVHSKRSNKSKLKVSFCEKVDKLDDENQPDNKTNTRENTIDVGDASKAGFNYPHGWQDLLEQFFLKHPPPRKRHLRLLTKNIPDGILKHIKDEANNLVERTIFILTLLDKSYYKAEHVLLIIQWQQDSRRSISPPRMIEDVTENELDISCV